MIYSKRLGLTTELSLTDGLINGELFLELPDDKELLDDLKLAPAFKRLVKRKAEEVST